MKSKFFCIVSIIGAFFLATNGTIQRSNTNSNDITFINKAIGGYYKNGDDKTQMVSFASTVSNVNLNNISEYGIKVYTSSSCEGTPTFTKSSKNTSHLVSNEGRFYTILGDDESISDDTMYYAKAYATISGTSYTSEVMNAMGNNTHEYSLSNTFLIKTSTGEGGSVTEGGNYRNGESCTVTATSNNNYEFVGWYENDIKVEGAGSTYTFTVNSPRTLTAKFEESITSIEVDSSSTHKTSYQYGETLDLTGLKINGFKYDGSKVDVTNDCSFTPSEGTSLTTHGTNTIQVNHTPSGKSTSFTVNVTKKETSISISGQKTLFTKGDYFSTGDAVVTAHFSDNTKETLSSGYTFSMDSSTQLNTGGTFSVTVTHTAPNITCSYNIYVGTTYDGNNLSGSEVFKINDIINFDYSGATKSVTLKKGSYKLETWGAQGGDNTDYSYVGGRGGYSSGTYTISSDTTLYITAGGAGGFKRRPSTSTYAYIAGGFNGGGGGTGEYLTSETGNGRDAISGGGATHIALQNGVLSSLSSNQDKVLIVAGGGGAACGLHYDPTYGGDGGGETTADIIATSPYKSSTYGATQSRGGYNYSNWSERATSGSFGLGGGPASTTQTVMASGGGGGYYGGGTGIVQGGTGGSGYVNTSYLSSTQNIRGDTSITSPSGTSETGHTGNGYCRITVLSLS